MSARSVPFAALSRSFVRQSESVGDDAATRTVYLVVGLLVFVGIALAVLAVWLWRATRPEPQLLAPLELMDERRWRRLDPQGRRRSLDAVRPDGALPLRPAKGLPDVDSEFAVTRPVSDFTDLADPDATEPTGAGAVIEIALPVDRDVSEADAVDAESADDAVVARESDDQTEEHDLPVESAEAKHSVEEASVREIAVAEPAEPSGPVDGSDVDEFAFDSDSNGGSDGGHADADDEREFEFDVPLMPGEGLLRRQRSENERT